MSRKSSAWIILVFIAFACAAMLHAALSLRIDTSTEDLISSDLPFRRAQSAYEQRFPRAGAPLVAVVDAPTPERAEWAANALARALSSDGGHFEEVYMPGGGEFFDRNGLLFLSVDELERVSDRLAEAQPFLGKLAVDTSVRGLAGILSEAVDRPEDAPGDPLARLLDALAKSVPTGGADARTREMSWRGVLSSDPVDEPDTTRIVQLRPGSGAGRESSKAELVGAIHEASSTLGLERHGARVRATGPIALAREELDSVARGLSVSGPISVVLVMGILLLGMRSLALVTSSVVVLLVGFALTLGFASVAIGRLNLISIAFGVLYIGLGADFAIHLALSIRARRAEGFGPPLALRGAVRDVGGSLGLCALTTMIGFFVFIPTDFDGVSELGLIAGAGMAISFVTSLLLMPALMSVLPSRWAQPRTARVSGRLLWLLHAPERHRAPILVFAGIVLLVGGYFSTGVRFDSDPLNLRNPGSESVRALRELREANASAHWRLTALAPDSKASAELRARLERSTRIDDTVSIESFIPDRQGEKLARIDDLAFILGPTLDPSASTRQPPTFEESVRALEVLRDSLDALLGEDEGTSQVRAGALSLRRGLDSWLGALEDLSREERIESLARLEGAWLGTFPLVLERIRSSLRAERITRGTLPDALRVRWLAPDGTRRIDVLPSGDLDRDVEMEAFIRETRRVAPSVVGAPIVHIESSRTIVDAFRRALTWAVLAVLLITLIAFRSVLTMLETVAPLVIGGAATLGVMALLDYPFNFANVIALPLLMGVGIDSAIHLVHRSKAGTHDRLLESATARGVLFSALTTISGFGSLAFSTHRGMSSMGFVLSIGMISILISTLVILPALLSCRASGAARDTGDSGGAGDERSGAR